MPSSHDHSKRYGSSSSVLLGYKFIVGASVLVLAAIIFVFPSVMDSVVWIPEAYTSSSTSTTCTPSISAVTAELFENSTGTVQTETNHMENSSKNSSFEECDIFEDRTISSFNDNGSGNLNKQMPGVIIYPNPDKSRIVKFPKDTEFKIRGDLSRRYEGPRTLRLDLIDELPALVYRDADIVVFDSWHWWNVDKTNHGENIFQEGDYLHPKLEINKAYKKAFTTWRKWIDNNIDSTRTQIVFRGYSVSHYSGGKWNTGGKCNRETEPIMSNETYIKTSPSRSKILEDVLGEMKSPVLYMNVSKLTYYRADAHPSVYAKNYSVQERIVALDHQDCSHWCLPGVPDTWNELLYASLLKAAKGSFGGGGAAYVSLHRIQDRKTAFRFVTPHSGSLHRVHLKGSPLPLRGLAEILKLPPPPQPLHHHYFNQLVN
ncbi:hypothetical protein C5167_040664 [Papaver somniferum]|uniref:Trichome birefringence-like C-terminal domain-containing protein n=1 Tax=Papaver somniferum TaxID=3469 RepID=A0A4Y7IFS5_PAPSO|nr:hypothetical protein C5167_040664 [Papaver somniferum]